MRKTMMMAAAALAAALSGCAIDPSPIAVTRYHLGTPLDRGSITVEPFSTTGPASLEYKTYAAAVQTELMRDGFTVPRSGSEAEYVAVVNFLRAPRSVITHRSPISVGIGAGSFGPYSGVSGGLSFPIGKNRSREIIISELWVQIRRRDDGTVIWEGRAQRAVPADAPEVQAIIAAPRMAYALFYNFPGESGITIEVK